MKHFDDSDYNSDDDLESSVMAQRAYVRLNNRVSKRKKYMLTKRVCNPAHDQKMYKENRNTAITTRNALYLAKRYGALGKNLKTIH